jgi:hypothetical protein
MKFRIDYELAGNSNGRQKFAVGNLSGDISEVIHEVIRDISGAKLGNIGSASYDHDTESGKTVEVTLFYFGNTVPDPINRRILGAIEKRVLEYLHEGESYLIKSYQAQHRGTRQNPRR